MGLLADSQRMGVAGAQVVPSEEAVVVGLVILELMTLEPGAP